MIWTILPTSRSAMLSMVVPRRRMPSTARRMMTETRTPVTNTSAAMAQSIASSPDDSVWARRPATGLRGPVTSATVALAGRRPRDATPGAVAGRNWRRGGANGSVRGVVMR